jgi:uncharacterized protein YjbJ (UPF0337 family)
MGCRPTSGRGAGLQNAAPHAAIVVHLNQLKEHTMNRDQVKGAVKDVAGKVQEKTGQATGDRSQQAKGLGKQAEGKVQKNVGNAKEVVKDGIDKI